MSTRKPAASIWNRSLSRASRLPAVLMYTMRVTRRAPIMPWTVGQERRRGAPGCYGLVHVSKQPEVACRAASMLHRDLSEPALQRLTACGDPLTQFREIEPGLAQLWKQLRLFFLHMVIDALGQDFESGIEAFVAGFHRREFFDQRLHQEVLYERFIHVVFVVLAKRFLSRRIEDFLLHNGVHGEQFACALNEGCLAFEVVIGGAFERVEQLLYRSMFFLKQRQCILPGRVGCSHDDSSRGVGGAWGDSLARLTAKRMPERPLPGPWCAGQSPHATTKAAGDGRRHGQSGRR